MKNQTHVDLVTHSSLALALALVMGSPVQARSTEPLASPAPVGQNEKGALMKGFVQDIESLAIQNTDFRRVLYTAENCQLVLMSLKPMEEIGAEVHKPDQFIRVEEGSGDAVLNGVRTPIRAGFAAVVPGGMEHNIINTGHLPLRLYTIYAPPQHRDGVVHPARADAVADNERFDGKTTE